MKQGKKPGTINESIMRGQKKQQIRELLNWEFSGPISRDLERGKN